MKAFFGIPGGTSKVIHGEMPEKKWRFMRRILSIIQRFFVGMLKAHWEETLQKAQHKSWMGYWEKSR